MGYVLIIAISVAVGVGVYRLTESPPDLDHEGEPEMWAGAVGAATLAFAIYLVGSALLSLLEKAASSPT